MRIICIGDYLGPDDLPVTIQQDNLHLISAESDATCKPLRYNVVEEKFKFWSYADEGEEAATISAMEASANPKNRVLRNLTTGQYVLEDQLPSAITIGHIVLMRICCFDIVDADMLENMNGEWEDVTEDTRDEVQVLWASHFGDNWETEWRV